jgi:AcrR family transcriptional regulator
VENQRVRLTKEMLRKSLTELLFVKNIHKISVREICERAEINRTTFYKYYGSQYDLLTDMENQVLNEIEGYLTPRVDNIKYDLSILDQMITFVGEHPDLFQILFNNNIDTKFPQKLFNLPVIREPLTDHLQTMYGNNSHEYVFSLIVNGGFSVIKDWINKANRESPEEIAGILKLTISRLLFDSILQP